MTLFAQQFAAVVIVIGAAAYLAWRFLPRGRAWLRVRLVRLLDAPGRPPRLRAWAARLASDAAPACGDGCGTCGGCAPKAAHVIAPPQARRRGS